MAKKKGSSSKRGWMEGDKLPNKGKHISPEKRDEKRIIEGMKRTFGKALKQWANTDGRKK